MSISREKCLELGNAVYGHYCWNEAMIFRLEELCNRAYAEGQKDERAKCDEQANTAAGELEKWKERCAWKEKVSFEEWEHLHAENVKLENAVLTLDEHNAEMVKALEDIASGEIGINIAMRLAKGVLARGKDSA